MKALEDKKTFFVSLAQLENGIAWFMRSRAPLGRAAHSTRGQLLAAPRAGTERKVKRTIGRKKVEWAGKWKEEMPFEKKGYAGNNIEKKARL